MSYYSPSDINMADTITEDSSVEEVQQWLSANSKVPPEALAVLKGAIIVNF